MTTIGPGADSDRKALARVTNMTLEAVSDQAVGIIRPKRRAFRQLVSLIQQRYINLTSDRNIQSGRHRLLSQVDLDRLFSEYMEIDIQPEQ